MVGVRVCVNVCVHVWRRDYIKLESQVSLDAAISLSLRLLGPAQGPVEVFGLNLSVPAHQLLQHRIVDEHVLILHTHTPHSHTYLHTHVHVHTLREVGIVSPSLIWASHYPYREICSSIRLVCSSKHLWVNDCLYNVCVCVCVCVGAHV